MEKERIKELIPDWAFGMNCAVTVCDKNLNIIYMNRRSRETYVKHGGEALIGKSLLPCHNEHSLAIMHEILETGEANAYTISKEGKRKMIYQTPWRDVEGNISGIVEISMVIPDDMPHYVRS